MRRDHGGGAAGVLALERFLPYRLSVLSNTVSGAIAAQYSDRFDLSIPEWRVMAVLGRFPGLSAVEVAERTAMDKVQVSRAVNRLMKAKRLQRLTDAADGRVRRLSLSPKGQAVYAQIVPVAQSFETRLEEALTDAERKALDALLAKLTDAARRL